nr:hypothetical protein [Bacteroides intestinalis]
MTYTPPQMEVIKMDLEGSVMMGSGGGSLNDFTGGGNLTPPKLQLRIEQRPGRPDKRHPHRGAIALHLQHKVIILKKRKETRQ